MQYPGFILNNILPSKQQVSVFTDELMHYMFPVAQDAQTFLQQHETIKDNLQQQLQQLLLLVDKTTVVQHNETIDNYFCECAVLKMRC